MSTLTTSLLPLCFAPVPNGIQHGKARHLALISEFLTDIGYIKGQANRVADRLSRNVLAREQPQIDLDTLGST